MTATAPRSGTRLIRLLFATAVLIVGLFGALSGTASAHAALTGSDPKDGAVVDVAPKDVTLTFSEQIAMGDDSIRVLDPASKRVDAAKLRDVSEGGTVRYAVDLEPGLPDGTYTVAWQAVSADSHPVSGAFTFSVGAPSKTTATVPDQEAGGGVVGLLYDTVRYISYAGFVLLVGGAAFVLACWQRGASVRPLQRLVVGGWVTLTAATLVLLLLRTPYTGSGKLGDAFDLGGLTDVLDTKAGAALVSRLLLLGAAALFIAVLFGAYAKRVTETEAETESGAEAGEGSGEGAGEGSDAGKAKADLTFGLGLGGTVVAAGIAGTWALSEHASTGIQTGLAMPLDVLHLLAVAAWLGGLVSLLIALYRTPDIERAAVQRFSRIAFGSVVVLAATGLYQAWRQVGSWSALTGTSYGQLLLVKVALIAVLLGAAWFSRRWTGLLGDVAKTEAEEEVEAEAEAKVEVKVEVEVEVEVEEETEAETEDGAGTGTNPERAVQLARQRTALATARKKRVRDADTERSGLRRSVLTEACVALVVLAVTTALTGTEPGRTEEKEVGRSGTEASAPAAPAGPVNLTQPFDTGGVKGKGTLRLSLDPASPGANLMHVWIDGPDGKPMDVPEVKVAYTLKSEQIGPLPVVPERLAAGHWSSANVQIPMPGEWQLQVTVRTSDIDQTTIEKNVKIG